MSRSRIWGRTGRRLSVLRFKSIVKSLHKKCVLPTIASQPRRPRRLGWWLDVEIQLTKGPHEADAAVAFDPDLRPGTRSAEPVDIGQAVFVEYGARLAAPVPRSAASSNNLRWCGSSA